VVTVRQAPLGPATQTSALEVVAAAAAAADKAEQEALAALAGSQAAQAAGAARVISQAAQAAQAEQVTPVSHLGKGNAMRYAIIENGVVVNVAVADAEFAAAQGWVSCPDTVQIRDTYDGQTFTPAPPAPPPPPPPTPTKEELLVKLQELQAQISALT